MKQIVIADFCTIEYLSKKEFVSDDLSFKKSNLIYRHEKCVCSLLCFNHFMLCGVTFYGITLYMPPLFLHVYIKGRKPYHCC